MRNLLGSRPVRQRQGTFLLAKANLLFAAGFLLIPLSDLPATPLISGTSSSIGHIREQDSMALVEFYNFFTGLLPGSDTFFRKPWFDRLKVGIGVCIPPAGVFLRTQSKPCAAGHDIWRS